LTFEVRARGRPCRDVSPSCHGLIACSVVAGLRNLGLDALATVGGILEINGATQLVALTGLDRLTTVGNQLKLHNLPKLSR